MVDPRKREARQAQEYLSRQFRSPTTQTLTNAGNTVLELFAGSGTTLFTDENRRQVENMLQTEVYADETQTAFDILPRLIYKRRNRKAYKVHLQMYLAQHIGRDPILNRALKVNCKNIE